MISTGITKKDYLDIIETVVDAYGIPLLEKHMELADEVYHFTAFRTSVMLAYLIESGRRPELLDLWYRVTEKSVRALKESRKSAYNDLTLEELCISFMLMRDYVKAEWIEVLADVTPDVHYAYTEKKSMNNMVVYGCVGMYLREKLTGKSCDEHFDKVMPWIMECLDENGMFDDHDHAMLYDLTTRVRLSQLLWFGYNGKWAKDIDSALRCAGKATLLMQSAAFQIPYGGRSNQLLHNEALLASLCEYEACRYKKEKNMHMAGQFKRAAHLATMSIMPYLKLPSGAKHIRNKFEQDSIYGVDDYGTFPRYMNALATFIACAYLMAEDDIEEEICPSEQGGYIFKTSPRFGKIFAAISGQSVEYALYADASHEPYGLGRYHASDVPAELGLSMPFVEKPKYILSPNRIPFDVIGPKHISSGFEHYVTDVVPSRLLAISPGYIDESGVRRLLCDEDKPYASEIIKESATCVSFRIEWGCATEEITLDSNGLHLSCTIKKGKETFWAVPMLSDNGGEKTEIEIDEKSVVVHLGDATYSLFSDSVSLSEEIVGNRNGIYRIAYADSNEIKLLLKKEK